MCPKRAVLFDLDGTILDTAEDIAAAVNQVRVAHLLPPTPFSKLREAVGHGVSALLKVGLDIDEMHPTFPVLLEECFLLYERTSTLNTQLFKGISEVFNYLDHASMPWGIVTNKPARFTGDLLKHFNLDKRTACVICGDTLEKRKPDPLPILHACQLLQCEPKNCLYIGDAEIDVLASKRANVAVLVALYGYIGENDRPLTWGADGYIKPPEEIITWIAANRP